MSFTEGRKRPMIFFPASGLVFGVLLPILLVHPTALGNLLPGDHRLDHPHHHHHHDHGHHDHAHAHHPEEHGAHDHHHQGSPPHQTSPILGLTLPLVTPLTKKTKPASKETSNRRPKQFKTSGNRKKARNFESRPFPFRIPRTNFSCRDRAPGYYADMEANCTVYQMCTQRGGRQAFFCPEATKFNQRTLVCDHVRSVECSEASQYFYRNVIIHEASLKATGRRRKSPKTKGKGLAKNRQKRPRLQTSNIINIRQPQIIHSRINGRLNFAPLFEKKQKLDFSRFTTPRPQRKSKDPDAGSLVEKPRSETSPSGLLSKKKLEDERESVSDMLDLPELPIEKESSGNNNNSPVFVITPKLVLNKPLADDPLAFAEETLQLLPPKEASQSVERFHKDPEQPALDLVPPPKSSAPVQFVGHVMSTDELRSFPNSPVVKIRGRTDAKMRTLPFTFLEVPDPKTSPVGRTKVTSQRSQTSGQPRSNDGFDQLSIGLPVQLKFPNQGLPDSLMWVDPGSLARSPMVHLRTLSNTLPVEHALTMNFPARTKKLLQPKCMRCLSTQEIVSKCRVLCVTIK